MRNSLPQTKNLRSFGVNSQFFGVGKNGFFETGQWGGRRSGADLPDSRQLRLNRLYPGSQVRKAAGHVLIPRPMTRPIAGQPIVDAELLAWATAVLEDIF